MSCTYDVTVRCSRATTVAVEKHILSVSVASVIHYATRMRHTVVFGLSVSTIFIHIIS